ncbi:MAG: hypothetical protein ABI596_08660 [Pyrinomonadaceae bacterium]
MQSRSIRHIGFFLAMLVVMGFCLVDASAQRRKKGRPRTVKRPVITNPAIEPATTSTSPESTTGQDKIISTADESSTETDPAAAKTLAGTKGISEQDEAINKLANQVDKLTSKLTQMEEKDTARADMDQLIKAEQRAEALRSQLIDVESKLADLHSRLEGVEYSLKPENIEKVTQGVGLVHPEEARDARRRQLESERGRLQSQIRILDGSKARLEPAISMADSEVDLLRARIQQQRERERAEPAPVERPTPRRKP